MKKNPFTAEQIEELKKNPYTLSVSANGIQFTYEFRILAFKKSQQGMSSTEIFKEAGYDASILGKRCMYDFLMTVKQHAKRPEGIQPSRSELKSQITACEKAVGNEKTDNKEIQHLKVQIEKLEQKIEFLKKISLWDPPDIL